MSLFYVQLNNVTQKQLTQRWLKKLELQEKYPNDEFIEMYDKIPVFSIGDNCEEKLIGYTAVPVVVRRGDEHKLFVCSGFWERAEMEASRELDRILFGNRCDDTKESKTTQLSEKERYEKTVERIYGHK